jgi:HD-like signal output (HDOD) protein
MNIEPDLIAQFQLRLERENYTLPTIPAASLRLMNLLSNPDCSVAEMEKTITFDPMLAGQVLKIANSCLYGTVMEVNSLKQAILRIGRKPLRTIVLMNSIKATLIKSRTFLPAMQAIWKQSLMCAFFSKLLAKRVRQDGDELFIMGLFHNIGKLMILSLLYEMFQQAETAMSQEMLDKAYATNQIEIGKKLLHLWKIPERIGAIIALQSLEQNLLDDTSIAEQNRRLAATIMLSQKLCLMVAQNVVEEDKIFPLFDFLGISQQALVEMVQQIHSVEKEVSPFT